MLFLIFCLIHTYTVKILYMLCVKLTFGLVSYYVQHTILQCMAVFQSNKLFAMFLFLCVSTVSILFLPLIDISLHAATLNMSKRKYLPC